MKAKKWIIFPIVITAIIIVCLICISLFSNTKQQDNTGVRQEDMQEDDDKTDSGETPMLPADSTTDGSGEDTQLEETPGTADSPNPNKKDEETDGEDTQDVETDGEDTKDDETDGEDTKDEETTPDNDAGGSIEMPYVPFN